MVNDKGRSFLTVIIIAACVALALRFFSAQFIRWSIDQHEETAQENLKLLSTALELYAKDHLGAYPQNLNLLTQNEPSYISKEYVSDSGKRKGYIISCPRLEQSSYSCSAVPVICGLTGKKTYTVTTGGPILAEECSKDEENIDQ